MTVEIRRGLGTRRDVQILLVTILIGCLAVAWALVVRNRLEGPRKIPVTRQSPEEILRLQHLARGPMRAASYLVGQRARVVTFAPAQEPLTHRWRGLEPGTILIVTALNLDGEDLWVRGVVHQIGEELPVVVHASFLEPYQPMVLEKVLELANVKILTEPRNGHRHHAIQGWIRNIGPERMPYLTIVCTFRDAQDQPVDEWRSEPIELRHLQVHEFQTHWTERTFASIALEIAYGPPYGLRHIMPLVVIPRANL